MNDGKVITRFPPSPTGPLHIGNVRTALFSYFFAKQSVGKFIVRVEDTDKARSKREYEDNMLESLKWLGLSRDGELWRQSERTEIYKKYLHKLIDDGKAYISKETEGENKEVVRFKNPNTTVTFEDLIRGRVTFDTTELGDFIIARNIDDPVYHMAVVVDDFEQGVTHIIRGEDHVSNTPRHILIQEAIGAPRPIYAHLPLILAPDRSKLSKRKHGESVSLDYYRNLGYLPEAIVNYLSLLGWNPGTNQELFTLDELIKKFDISKIQRASAIFDIEKLNWVNKEYLLKMNQALRIMNYEKELQKSKMLNYTKEILEKIEPIITERINKFGDVKDLGDRGELDFFFGQPTWKKEEFLWKGEGEVKDVIRRLQEVVILLDKLDEKSFTNESVKSAIWPYAEREGRGMVLWPLRYALSGLPKSPDPFTIAEVIGKEETLARLNSAINFLNV